MLVGKLLTHNDISIKFKVTWINLSKWGHRMTCSLILVIRQKLRFRQMTVYFECCNSNTESIVCLWEQSHMCATVPERSPIDPIIFSVSKQGRWNPSHSHAAYLYSTIPSLLNKKPTTNNDKLYQLVQCLWIHQWMSKLIWIWDCCNICDFVHSPSGKS